MRINNIAELKTRKGTSNANVEVLGYYTSGDGGGGDFYWDNSSVEADNGGTIIQVTGVVTGRWKRIFSTIVHPLWFGAIDNNSTDSTSYIQNAINSLSDNQILDGSNGSYVVTSLNIKSNSTVKNFYLKTKAGSVNFVSPITIDGTVDAKENIYLLSINIDGNRANQTNLPVSGFAEDGGRNGFRILGFINNLRIENCSANYCANDGISLYSSISATNSDANHCFTNIKIDGFKGNWNRRHGMSIDCVNYFDMNNTEFRHNGKDLNIIDAQSVGTRGARVPSGFLYGNGCDFEDYGVGTGIQNINIQNIDTTNNSYAGFVITSSADPTSLNFIRRKNIKIDNIVSSKGDDILLGSPPSIDYSALKVTSLAGVSALGYVYENIDITNSKIVGRLELRAVTGLNYKGSIEFSIGFFQIISIDNKDIYIESISKGASLYSSVATTLNYNEVLDATTGRVKIFSDLIMANASLGRATLLLGTVTVSNTSVTSNSQIFLTIKTPSGVLGLLSYVLTAGVGFVINSSSATDNSIINWLIIN